MVFLCISIQTIAESMRECYDTWRIAINQRFGTALKGVWGDREELRLEGARYAVREIEVSFWHPPQERQQRSFDADGIIVRFYAGCRCVSFRISKGRVTLKII